MNIGFDMVNRSIIGSIKNFTDKFLPAMISTFMENDKIKKLQMNSNFDLVVMEYFINEALLGYELFVVNWFDNGFKNRGIICRFAVKFDCPALVISSLPMLTSLNELSRNLMVPSITPNMLFPFDNHMTFIQRAKNFGAYVSEIIVNQ